jgi:DNA-binding transcriptional regulator YiaG
MNSNTALPVTKGITLQMTLLTKTSLEQINEDFRKHFNILMIQANLTNKELAARLDLDDGTIARWKNGTKIPSSKYWPDLVFELGLTHWTQLFPTPPKS